MDDALMSQGYQNCFIKQNLFSLCYGANNRSNICTYFRIFLLKEKRARKHYQTNNIVSR